MYLRTREDNTRSLLPYRSHPRIPLQAFVIAYTSDFIPRFVYKLYYSENNDLVGYMNSSLSGESPGIFIRRLARA